MEIVKHENGIVVISQRKILFNFKWNLLISAWNVKILIEHLFCSRLSAVSRMFPTMEFFSSGEKDPICNLFRLRNAKIMKDGNQILFGNWADAVFLYLKAHSHSPQQFAFSAIDCVNAEIEKFLYLWGKATVCLNACRKRSNVNEPRAPCSKSF